MKFKKIYIEITNICNLNCSFCSKTKRTKKEMTIDEFEKVLEKIDNYTDYLYLHIQGEPLLHSKLDELLKLCEKNKKFVNITTNGVFLNEKVDILNNHSCVRQLNISLHCENNKKDYFKDIFEAVDKLNKNIYISYRIWIDDKENIILDNLKNKYGDIVLSIKNKNNIVLAKNIYLNKNEKFIWPNLDNSYYNEIGTCLGLKSHIGILSDGTVIICCLDSDGISNLGNIFTEKLSEILEKNEYTISNFNNNKCVLELCKHCSYKDRFNRIKEK